MLANRQGNGASGCLAVRNERGSPTHRERRARTVAAVLTLLLTAFLCVSRPVAGDSPSGPVVTAALQEVPEAKQPIRSDRPHPLVRRAQGALAKVGLYKGPINGVMGVETKAAVRNYQKIRNMRVTGAISEELVTHLETAFKVDDLLKHLDEVRESKKEAAREALLSRPETRHLVVDEVVEQADPSRDPTPCFRDPTARCLLAEAAESAKAIPKDKMRDWALGEILASQAMAGLIQEAMATVRRIRDPRLIMVALREIAESLAKAGYFEESLTASKIIPDPSKMADALAAIAEIFAGHENADEARRTVVELVALLDTLDDPLRRIELRASGAKVLSRIGDADGALEQIRRARAAAVSEVPRRERGRALRHVAAALAEMGWPDDALKVMADVDKPQDRIPVLVAAATAQADAGDSQLAIATAENIKAARYRAVVFGHIAIAQARAGNVDAARDAVMRARSATAEIKQPFARSYATSRIALALAELGKSGRHPFFDEAVQAAAEINDDRLRAQILWTVAAERERMGDTDGALRTAKLARQASDEIKSPLSRIWVYGDIASAHVAAGDEKAAWLAFRNALSVAEKVHNPWARARALSRLAAALTELTQGNEAGIGGVASADKAGAAARSGPAARERPPRGMRRTHL